MENKLTISTIIKLLRDVCPDDMMYNADDVQKWIKYWPSKQTAEVICGSHNLLVILLRALEDMEVG